MIYRILTDTPNAKDYFLVHRNSPEAFTWLYQNYWEPLLKFAANYVSDRDTCEEIVQKLFIHLFTAGSKLNINASISSYLFAALRNRIYNYLRDRALYKRHTILAGRSAQHWHNNVDQSLGLMDLEKEIQYFLDRLPAKYRDVYSLHERDYLSVKEIALILHRPQDTVEKQLRKAITLLRDHLRHYKLHK